MRASIKSSFPKLSQHNLFCQVLAIWIQLAPKKHPETWSCKHITAGENMRAKKGYKTVHRLTEARHQLSEQEGRSQLQARLSLRFPLAIARRSCHSQLSKFETWDVMDSFFTSEERRAQNLDCLNVTYFFSSTNILPLFFRCKERLTAVKIAQDFVIGWLRC